MTNTPTVIDHCVALQRSLEQYATALEESQHRVDLLTTDLKEWADVFGEYGQTPEACLHKLLTMAQSSDIEGLPKPDSCMASQAQAWTAVWEVLLHEACMKTCNQHDASGQEIAIKTIRSLIKRARKKGNRKDEIQRLRNELAVANSQLAALNQRIFNASAILCD